MHVRRKKTSRAKLKHRRTKSKRKKNRRRNTRRIKLYNRSGGAYSYTKKNKSLYDSSLPKVLDITSNIKFLTLKDLMNIREAYPIFKQDNSPIIRKIRDIKDKLEDYKNKINKMDGKDKLLTELNEIVQKMNNKLYEYDRGIEADDAEKIKDDALNYIEILNHTRLDYLIGLCNSILDNKLSPEELDYELLSLSNSEQIVNTSIPDLKSNIEQFKENPDIYLP